MRIKNMYQRVLDAIAEVGEEITSPAYMHTLFNILKDSYSREQKIMALVSFEFVSNKLKIKIDDKIESYNESEAIEVLSIFFKQIYSPFNEKGKKELSELLNKHISKDIIKKLLE